MSIAMITLPYKYTLINLEHVEAIELEGKAIHVGSRSENRIYEYSSEDVAKEAFVDLIVQINAVTASKARQ